MWWKVEVEGGWEWWKVGRVDVTGGEELTKFRCWRVDVEWGCGMGVWSGIVGWVCGVG